MTALTTPLNGLDYTAAIPAERLKQWGVSFVARYLSNDPWKNLSLGEARDLRIHGIHLITVWEDGAADAYLGANVGRSHAEQHVAMATACGKGKAGFYYFAVDTDVNHHPELTDAYFDGVASVIGKDRCGPYGGIEVVKHQLDRGFGAAWQTYAWSHDQRDGRAQVHQHENGPSVDKDHAYFQNFGQWDWVGPPPPNVEHYERFLGTAVQIGRKKYNEREIVKTFDELEPHHRQHPIEHAMLHHDIKVLRNRIMAVAHNIDRHPFDRAWQGWRWQQLNHRLGEG